MYKGILRCLTLLFSLAGFTAFAQSGTITGTILDAQTQETLIGVTVVVAGQNKGVATDIEGKFRISELGAGTHTLNITYVGYKPLQIKDVKVEAAKNTELNISLEANFGLLQEVVVSARVDKGSSFALINDRKLSSLVLQKVGSEELTLKGIGNVGEGLKKVVGVAMVGDKSLFVRGLGDRYNNATLNGLPIPSTNPDVKLIPLDIFPTAIVKNIEVLKSYNSVYYGDFSGGTIDIVTRDYPEKAFTKLSLSAGYNSISTGKEFLGKKRGFADILGFSRGNRAIPDVVNNSGAYDSYFYDNENPGFKTPFTPYKYTAPMNTGISFSSGNRYLLNNNRTFGYLLTVSNSNEYAYQPGRSAWYNAQQDAIYDFTTEDYFYKTNTSALLSLYLKSSPKTNVSVTGLFVNDSRDGVQDNYGENWDLGPVYGRRNTLIQNTLGTGQVSVNHRIASNWSLSGAVGYTKTNGSIPDRAQIMVESRGEGQYQFSPNGITDINRFFAKLDDHDMAAHINSNLKPAKIFNELNFGFDVRYKKRKFDARQIDADAKSIRRLFSLDQLDEVLSPASLGVGNSSTWRYKEVPNEQNRYRSEMQIYAPYVSANFLWAEKWNLTAGLRFEKSVQSTDYKLDRDIVTAPYRNNTIDGNDFLPSLTLKYNLTPNSSLILAGSKTISRPLFTEAAPFRYNESAGTAQRQGNQYLKNGSNYNVDLRYDLYPNAGEIISFSVFGKRLVDPIELVRLNGSEPMFSFVNSDRAMVAGVEIEINKNLGKLFNSDAGVLQNVTLGLNGSYLYTQVEFDIDKLQDKGVPFYPTNFKRPLFGASPYLINADVSYLANWSKTKSTSFSLTYNVFGKRLFIAGAQGTGDIYELPVNTLNFNINNTLSKNIDFKLGFTNLLNPNIVYNQEFSTSNLEYMNIRKGVSINATLSYSF